MARRKGGQKIMVMAKAGAAKRAERKRFRPSNVTGKPKSELFNASELGDPRWERSWSHRRAKNRKFTGELRKQYEKAMVNRNRRAPNK